MQPLDLEAIQVNLAGKMEMAGATTGAIASIGIHSADALNRLLRTVKLTGEQLIEVKHIIKELHKLPTLANDALQGTFEGMHYTYNKLTNSELKLNSK